jgi:outer membrane protein TolC
VRVVDEQTLPEELAAVALSNRPELAQSRALVGLAAAKLRQAKYGPLLPSVLLNYRAGGFGGGRNGFFGDYDGRSDFDAALVWQVRSLGLGNLALRRQRDAETRQAQLQEIAEMDRVVTEVAVALAGVKSRRAQLGPAEQAVQSAARSHELNFKLFKEAGIEAIRPLEVLQSIQALGRARQDYLNGLIEHNRAQFQLHWALGYPVSVVRGP